MAKPTRNDPSTFHRFRFALGGIILALIFVGAWYSDEISSLFARRPTVADIAGAWTFDEAEFAKSITADNDGVPTKELKRFQDGQRKLGEAYKGAVYTFKPDAYTLSKAGKTQEFRCAYYGQPTGVIMVAPAERGGPGAMSLVLDRANQRLLIKTIDMAFPLAKSE